MRTKKFTTKMAPYIKDLKIPEKDYEKLSIIEYKRGEIICRQEDSLSSVIVIIEGRAKITVTAMNGKRMLVGFDDNAGIIGDIEFITKTPASCTVTVLQNLKGIVIPFSYLENQLLDSKEAFMFLFKDMGMNLRNFLQRSILNTLYTVNNRICAYIEAVSIKNIFCENLLDTAELLGTSYRHLLRTLQQLCEKNILKRTKKGVYTILDEKKLERSSDGCFENLFRTTISQLPSNIDTTFLRKGNESSNGTNNS